MTDRRPTGTGARGSRRSTAPSRALRFPCGHLEDESSALSRMRDIRGAGWVACRRCNLVALVTAHIPAARRPAARR